ncbi:Hypothetical predicted protein [Xyrichtys novacula]|uniref:Uncharacterized protein n=1 Tax=Xyrichtys novacula TaxID=13765 RepID=A0AAV1H6R2_XYRNO|nr:Hypothetical predicted protein [Xyrichtys novacula]
MHRSQRETKHLRRAAERQQRPTCQLSAPGVEGNGGNPPSLCQLSNFTAPQAECKLENTEGNRNQARCCRANTPNRGPLRGGSSAERYGAIGPQGNGGNERSSVAALTHRQSDYSFSAIWEALSSKHCCRCGAEIAAIKIKREDNRVWRSPRAEPLCALCF